MIDRVHDRTPVLFWPFVGLWRLLTFVLAMTGRILCAVLGMVLTGAGVLVMLSVVGLPVGIPLAVFGALLIARALF
jgi:hypothetical protein